MGKLIPAKERAYVSNSSKMKYEFLVGKGKGKKKFFKSQAALFDFCAAMGIRDDCRTQVEDRHELVQSYSIDKEDALALLVLGKEPTLESDQVLRRLEEYAEYGIDKIYTWVTNLGARDLGDLHLVDLLKLDLDGAITEDMKIKEAP